MKRQCLRRLTATITACLLPATWAEAATDYLGAYTATENIYLGDDRHFAEVNFLGDANRQFIEKFEFTAPRWSLTGEREPIIKATLTGIMNWADIMGNGTKHTRPWQIFVGTNDDQNAYAVSQSLLIPDGFKNGDSYVQEQLLDGAALTYITPDSVGVAGKYGYSGITFGRYFGADKDGAVLGWHIDADTPIPTNEQAADLIGTVRHELGHALGIAHRVVQVDWHGNLIGDDAAAGSANTTADGKYLLKFHPDIANDYQWSLHLKDQNGNSAVAGKYIATTAGAKELKAKGVVAAEGDCFIVDNEITADGKGFAYFYGDHVTEALGGAKFFGRSALPVNGWEGNANFEGSHLQTAGMMSHRDFSNYTSFMEVELAVMQDLGYTLDRRAYFGRSVYGDGETFTNTQGFAARNEAGDAYTDNFSQVPLGVGLHVYGSNNTITQGADILTQGRGAIGIRVDGTANSIIVPSGTQIHADGVRGNGILVAYGRNQTINQNGTVTALGEGGTGVRFDFGSSSNGARDEYRGSFIRYKRKVQGYDTKVAEDKWGSINNAKNLSLADMNANEFNAAADELNGPMADSYSLSGTLEGKDNAIYIAKNAFVREINLTEGAAIAGNITSDWKHFDTDGSYNPTGLAALKIQYGADHKGENGYDYNAYIPDLVTNLNLKTDLVYDGNINGPDNLKLNVLDGVFDYGGSANVVNVTVAKSGTVYGGDFTVNDMKGKLAAGFSDDTTGQIINRGTLGAGDSDNNLTIRGKLVSSGNLIGYGGGSGGQIAVTGAADIEGSTVTAQNLLPGETITVLTATEGIAGSTANHVANPAPVSAMLNVVSQKTTEGITVTAEEADNIGNMTEGERETYRAMGDMSLALQSAGDAAGMNELRPLYAMNAPAAKQALREIGSPVAAQVMTMAQQSTVSAQAISDRLSAAFTMTPAEVALPRNNLAGSAEENPLTVTANIPTATVGNGWVKFAKHWGEMKSGANYHGSAVSGGYDRAVNPYWRVGTFITYNDMSYGAESAAGSVYDTRLGLYAGYHKGANDAYIYLDYGWQRNRLRRSVMGMSASAAYGSRLIELGGEYKHDLHAAADKIWHVSPYVGFQASRLTQDSYSEEGASALNHNASSSQRNNYFALQTGLELKRYVAKGSYGLRLGVKHAFGGANPEINFHYEGNPGSAYTLKDSQDKTHFVMSLTGDAEFKRGWIFGGDLQLQKGPHDRDLTAALTIRRVW